MPSLTPAARPIIMPLPPCRFRPFETARYDTVFGIVLYWDRTVWRTDRRASMTFRIVWRHCNLCDRQRRRVDDVCGLRRCRCRCCLVVSSCRCLGRFVTAFVCLLQKSRENGYRCLWSHADSHEFTTDRQSSYSPEATADYGKNKRKTRNQYASPPSQCNTARPYPSDSEWRSSVSLTDFRYFLGSFEFQRHMGLSSSDSRKFGIFGTNPLEQFFYTKFSVGRKSQVRNLAQNFTIMGLETSAEVHQNRKNMHFFVVNLPIGGQFP